MGKKKPLVLLVAATISTPAFAAGGFFSSGGNINFSPVSNVTIQNAHSVGIIVAPTIIIGARGSGPTTYTSSINRNISAINVNSTTIVTGTAANY